MNILGLVAVPEGVLTTTGPFVAPSGTMATIFPRTSFWTTAATPLKVTLVAPASFRPQICDPRPHRRTPGRDPHDPRGPGGTVVARGGGWRPRATASPWSASSHRCRQVRWSKWFRRRRRFRAPPWWWARPEASSSVGVAVARGTVAVGSFPMATGALPGLDRGGGDRPVGLGLARDLQLHRRGDGAEHEDDTARWRTDRPRAWRRAGRRHSRSPCTWPCCARRARASWSR